MLHECLKTRYPCYSTPLAVNPSMACCAQRYEVPPNDILLVVVDVVHF
jgi:hypothetical protein